MLIQLERNRRAFRRGVGRLRRLFLLASIGVAHLALFAIFRPPLIVRGPTEPPVVFTLSPPDVTAPQPRGVRPRTSREAPAITLPRIILPPLPTPTLHELPSIMAAETEVHPLPAGDEDEKFDQYRQQIETIIAANRHYPPEAMRRRQTGAIEIAFAISADGSVGPISLLTSSRHKLLDREAVELVRRCAPFPPPPTASPLHISLPVIFALQEKAGA